MEQFVRVGVGVLIFNNGKFLLLKRKGSHGEGTWALPGGHLNFNESLTNCAIRELKEENGLEIIPEKVISVSNNIMYNKHYITIGILAKFNKGEPKILEPDKCERMDWFDFDTLPNPLFIATKSILDNYRNNNIIKLD